MKWATKVSILLLLPAGALLNFFALFPMGFSIYLSFMRWELGGSFIREWVGLGNYIQIVLDPEFHHVLRVSTLFMSLGLLIEFSIGVGIALVVWKIKRGGEILRLILLAPLIMPSVVSGILWRVMYHESRGVINYALGLLFNLKLAWLRDPSVALLSIMTVDTWRWAPFTALILSAALEALPKEPYEAAKIDGATWWQVLRHITLPMVMPILLFLLLMRGIGCFQMFDEVYVVTRGGPGMTTRTLSMQIFYTAYQFYHLGLAAAMSWILIMVTSIIAYFLIRMLMAGGVGR